MSAEAKFDVVAQDKASDVVKKVGEQMDNTAEKAKQANEKTTKAVGETFKAFNNLGTSALALYAAVDAVGDAQLRLDNANLMLNTSMVAVERSQLAYNRALQRCGKDSEEAKLALQALEVAEERQAVYLDKVDDAADALNQTMIKSALTVIPSLITAITSLKTIQENWTQVQRIAAGVKAVLTGATVTQTAAEAAATTSTTALTAATEAMSIAQVTATTTTTALIAALTPLILPIAAIGAAVALFAAAWSQNWFGIRDVLNEVIASITKAWGDFQSWISDSVERLYQKFGKVTKSWKDTVSEIKKGAAELEAKGYPTYGIISKLPETPLNIVWQAPVAEQFGGTGIVTKPTLFLAGEAGPESFAFKPGLGGVGEGTKMVNVYIYTGPIASEADVERLYEIFSRRVREEMKGSVFGVWR